MKGFAKIHKTRGKLDNLFSRRRCPLTKYQSSILNPLLYLRSFSFANRYDKNIAPSLIVRPAYDNSFFVEYSHLCLNPLFFEDRIVQYSECIFVGTHTSFITPLKLQDRRFDLKKLLPVILKNHVVLVITELNEGTDLLIDFLAGTGSAVSIELVGMGTEENSTITPDFFLQRKLCLSSITYSSKEELKQNIAKNPNTLYLFDYGCNKDKYNPNIKYLRFLPPNTLFPFLALEHQINSYPDETEPLPFIIT